MKKRIRIAIVGYLNTLPFQWAFEEIMKDIEVDLKLVTPSECAELLKHDKVDLSLIPVGALEDVTPYRMVTDFGISCDGEVRTVCMFSNSPIKDVNMLYLDDHSRTSQKLALIVTRDSAGKYIDNQVIDVVQKLDEGIVEGEAILMIGDKVLQYENQFKYKYDLGELWKERTGLPFVFAVWAHKENSIISPDILDLINNGFTDIINNLEQRLAYEQEEQDMDISLIKYFRKNILYKMGKDKQMGLQLFLKKSENLPINRNKPQEVESH